MPKDWQRLKSIIEENNKEYYVKRQHNKTAQPYSHTLTSRQSPSNLSKAPDKLVPIVAALDTSLIK